MDLLVQPRPIFGQDLWHEGSLAWLESPCAHNVILIFSEQIYNNNQAFDPKQVG